MLKLISLNIDLILINDDAILKKPLYIKTYTLYKIHNLRIAIEK